ncbi:hypothetical protein AB2B41_23805, partial [Marimonas sp. MJW-29]
LRPRGFRGAAAAHWPDNARFGHMGRAGGALESRALGTGDKTKRNRRGRVPGCGGIAILGGRRRCHACPVL